MKFKLSDKFIDFAFRHDKGEVGIVAVNEIIYHELIEAGLPKNGIMQLVENAE